MDTDYLIVFTTCASEEEATTLAKAAVKQQAAACCNIIKDVRSIYVWQGQANDDREVLLVSKTTAKSFPQLRELIQKLHSYDVPEIIAMPVVAGNDDYLNWVTEQTTS